MCFKIVAYIILFLLTRNDGKMYRNHALLRTIPIDFDDLAFVKRLDMVYNVTFWRAPTLVDNPVEFSISPENLAKLYRDTNGKRIRFLTIMKDIQSAFDREEVRTYTKSQPLSFSWRYYYRLQDIYDWLKDLEDLYPHEVRLRNIGQSHENRDIIAVKITLKGSIRRSKVIVEGGCHGNEWISPAFVTYMIHTLLHAKEYNNEELFRIALMYTWIFVPVMNPDGYEYAHTKDRLWRKNRNGVDLNRNYGIAFGAYCPDISNVESRDYCGQVPFSEKESYAMSMYTKENSDNLEYYFSIHAYGQNIILPYAYTMAHKENYVLVSEICNEVAGRIYAKHGTNYSIGNSYELKGHFASGVSTDWVKRALQVSYALTIELPDRGMNGYSIPPLRILPTCQATMDGLLVILDPQTEEFVRRASGSRKIGIRAATVVFCNLFIYILIRMQ